MNPVTKGKATLVGTAYFILSVIAVIVAKVQEDGVVLGVSPELAAKLGAGVALLMLLGRTMQAINVERPVVWSFTSTFTFIGAVFTTLQLVVADMFTNLALIGLPPNLVAWLSAAFTAAFVLYRQLQAAFGKPTIPEAVLPDAGLTAVTEPGYLPLPDDQVTGRSGSLPGDGETL